MRLHARIDLREGADRAGDRAGGDLLARRDQPLARAGELGIGDRELDAEGGRLGVDAVRAADGRRLLVLEGAALQRGEELVDVGDQDVGGARELHVEAGVEHVRRGHAGMHEPRLGADDLGKMRQEGDHVVLGDALDLVDPGHVERGVLALGPDFLRRGLRHDAELGHGVCGMRLDLEPDAKPRLRRPDRNHFGTGVTRDHRGLGRGRYAVCIRPEGRNCKPEWWKSRLRLPLRRPTAWPCRACGCGRAGRRPPAHAAARGTQACRRSPRRRAWSTFWRQSRGVPPCRSLPSP